MYVCSPDRGGGLKAHKNMWFIPETGTRIFKTSRVPRPSPPTEYFPRRCNLLFFFFFWRKRYAVKLPRVWGGGGGKQKIIGRVANKLPMGGEGGWGGVVGDDLAWRDMLAVFAMHSIASEATHGSTLSGEPTLLTTAWCGTISAFFFLNKTNFQTRNWRFWRFFFIFFRVRENWNMEEERPGIRYLLLPNPRALPSTQWPSPSTVTHFHYFLGFLGVHYTYLHMYGGGGRSL